MLKRRRAHDVRRAGLFCGGADLAEIDGAALTRRARLAIEALDPETPRESLVLRQGRVIGWLEDALAPLRSRLSPPALKRLVLSIRSAIGIEAFVWLVDVGGLSREEAAKTMRWTAKTLLRGALTPS